MFSSLRITHRTQLVCLINLRRFFLFRFSSISSFFGTLLFFFLIFFCMFLLHRLFKYLRLLKVQICFILEYLIFIDVLLFSLNFISFCFHLFESYLTNVWLLSHLRLEKVKRFLKCVTQLKYFRERNCILHLNPFFRFLQYFNQIVVILFRINVCLIVILYPFLYQLIVCLFKFFYSVQ